MKIVAAADSSIEKISKLSGMAGSRLCSGGAHGEFSDAGPAMTQLGSAAIAELSAARSSASAILGTPPPVAK
jgi:hypothetical protein